MSRPEADAEDKIHRAFNVLCLSGGGYLGLFTATILAGIEEQIGEPIARRFDLLAGTSVGGIIALALANEVPASKIKEVFVSYGPAVFSSNNKSSSLIKSTRSLLRNARKAQYTGDKLGTLIGEAIGAELKIGDLKHRVIIPAVNLTKGSPQVFKTAHHPSFVRDWKLRAIDVALATSAAPTYFPMHRIGGELFADGGMYANAPDLMALHEAEHFLGARLEDIRILSIGTTSTSFSFSNRVGTNLGWLSWMHNQRLSTVMIASQQLIVDYMLKHRLSDRYLRIDRSQSHEQEGSLGLDIASPAAIFDLQALGEASLREHLGRQSLPNMLEHVAVKPTFYHKVM